MGVVVFFLSFVCVFTEACAFRSLLSPHLHLLLNSMPVTVASRVYHEFCPPQNENKFPPLSSKRGKYKGNFMKVSKCNSHCRQMIITQRETVEEQNWGKTVDEFKVTFMVRLCARSQNGNFK